MLYELNQSTHVDGTKLSIVLLGEKLPVVRRFGRSVWCAREREREKGVFNWR